MSPLVAVRMPRHLGTDACSSPPCLLPGSSKSWVAIDYASCGAAAWHARWISLPEDRRVHGPMAPAQISQYARRPFVTDSLREQSPVPSDSPSCELTRRFPKRTTSDQQSSISASPVLFRGGRCQCRPLLRLAALLRFGLTTLLRRRQRLLRCGLRVAPWFSVAQHRPAPHQNLSRHGYDRLLLAPLATARQPQVEVARPGVITQHAPGAFDQQLPQQRRTPLRDTPT